MLHPTFNIGLCEPTNKMHNLLTIAAVVNTKYTAIIALVKTITIMTYICGDSIRRSRGHAHSFICQSAMSGPQTQTELFIVSLQNMKTGAYLF